MKSFENCSYKTTKPYYPDFKEALVVKVYDADTFWIVAPINGVMYRFSARLYGVDAPEMKDQNLDIRNKAKNATKIVSDMILNKVVNVIIHNGQKKDGKVVTEKFGRLLITLTIDGIDLANYLVQMGLVKSYFGGTKELFK